MNYKTVGGNVEYFARRFPRNTSKDKIRSTLSDLAFGP